jgi:hypothetical protein
MSSNIIRSRISLILFSPLQSWTTIATMRRNPIWHTLAIVALPLLMIELACRRLDSRLLARSISSQIVEQPITQELVMLNAKLLEGLLCVLIPTCIGFFAARIWGGRPSLAGVLEWTVYSKVPAVIGSVFLLLRAWGGAWITILLSCYSLWLLYLGVDKMLLVPTSRRLVTFVTFLVLTAVLLGLTLRSLHIAVLSYQGIKINTGYPTQQVRYPYGSEE